VRAVIQRVKRSWVEVEGRVVGSIGRGLNVLLGIGKDDDEKDAEVLAKKIVNLRIFENEKGKFYYSLLDIGGHILVISQFTLYANVRKGRRPSFEEAKAPSEAERLYEFFIERLKDEGIKVEKGIFGAMMNVYIENWGPVTIVMDSKELL